MRLVPAAAAATAVVLLAATTGGATAAAPTTGPAAPAAVPAPTPAAGSAAATLSLLQLSAGSTTVEAGVVELLAETLAAPVAKVVVTPVRVGATAYGRQSVEGRTASVPVVDTATVAPQLAGLLGLVAPGVDAGASTTADSAESTARTAGLGGVELLGLPVALDGSVTALSRSTPTAALGEQSLVVRDLALPSLDDLLTALGIDLSALPVGVLYELLDRLDLVTPTVEDLKRQLDAARARVQARIDAAESAVAAALQDVADVTAQLAGKQTQLNAKSAELSAALAAVAPLAAARDAAQDAVDAADQQLAAATTELAGATTALNAARALPLLPGTSLAPLEAAVAAAQAAVTSAQSGVTRATTALTAATAELAAAQDLADAVRAAVTLLQQEVAALRTLLAAAQQLLDDAYAALGQVLSAVTAEVDALLGAVRAVLDGTPLVSLDSLEVATRTVVDSAAPGGQRAQVMGGRVAGLRVLGTDVLSDVLGSTQVDLLGLTSGQAAELDALVGSLTGALSQVLSSVPLFPSLSVPAPQVDVLVTEQRTGVQDGFGVASAVVQLLRVSLPPVTVPLGLALPGAGALPVFGAGGVSAAAVGDLVSRELSLGVGALGPAARFRPAGTTSAPGGGTAAPGPVPTPGPTPRATPGTTPRPTTTTQTITTTSARPLPATGPSVPVAVAGLGLLAGAALVRRRRALGDPDAG